MVNVLDVQSNRVNAFDKDDLFVLQTLADQIAIAIEARLYQDTLARQRIEQELALAAEIRSSLLPESPPIIPGWEVAAFWRPALEMAGDFYDFLSLTEGRWGIVIADVSDKGIPAAIFMAVAQSSIRASVLGRRPPAEALERANATPAQGYTHRHVCNTVLLYPRPVQRDRDLCQRRSHPTCSTDRPPARPSISPSRGIVLGAVEPIKLEEHCATMEQAMCWCSIPMA